MITKVDDLLNIWQFAEKKLWIKNHGLVSMPKEQGIVDAEERGMRYAD